MKTTLSEQAYQWTDDQTGGWHVGRLRLHAGYVISGHRGVMRLEDLELDECVLIRHAHSGDEEFIEHERLSPYIVPAQFKDTPAEVQVKS